MQTSRQFLVFRVFFLRAALLYSSYMFVHFHSDDHSILTLFQSVSQGDRLLLTVRAGVLNVTLSPLFGWCKPDPALHLVKKASKGTHRIYSASCLPTHHLRLFVLSPHSDSLSLSPSVSLACAGGPISLYLVRDPLHHQSGDLVRPRCCWAERARVGGWRAGRRRRR